MPNSTPTPLPAATTLRHALASAPRDGVGRPYPAALRADVVRFTQGEVARGQTLASVALALDLTTTTLTRWMGSPSYEPAFASVVLAQPSRPTSFVLHLPGGLRVEGLSIEQLAELCGRLGS